jgi:4-amino-4-deoxy-L-arabinose transferase-like glycosyltransferase
MRRSMRDVMRLHWPFALLAALGLWLMLANLGADYLWEDEGDTAVLASNILKFGVPKAWDGVTFTDADKGARLNDNLVMVSHPWAQYYAAAGSFFLFGESTFAARLPFALAGWLTIVLVYLFTLRISGNRWAAFGAATLLVLSVQFLLYCRQCRNYSLNMLFTCALVWIFLRMKSWRECALFALVAVLLFHTHPIGIVPVAVLGILTLIYRPLAAQRRWFWLAAPAIAIFTLPWLALARSGYAENVGRVEDVEDFFLRLVQYLIECASVAPLIGCAVLLLLCWIRWRMQPKSESGGELGATNGNALFEKSEANFLIVAVALIVAYAFPMAIMQSSNSLFLFGIRYVPAVIPLVAMVAGILIWKAGREKVLVWSALLLIFGFTKLGQLNPFVSWAPKIGPDAKKFVQAHVPNRLFDAFVNTEQYFFLRDLWHENPGTVGQTCKILGQFAKPGDRLIANYGWESLYFYTRLPQALKILPDYPIYNVARRKGLPDYVFDPDHARWIVWRLYWEGYQGYRWNEVEQKILEKGGRLTQVAEVEETLWENRENIHFRRFSGRIHLYPWGPSFPPEGIFRVDWSNDTTEPPR